MKIFSRTKKTKIFSQILSSIESSNLKMCNLMYLGIQICLAGALNKIFGIFDPKHKGTESLPDTIIF